MILEFLNMNGYGLYVISAFAFTLMSFTVLYLVIRSQLIKEQKKFVAKFGALSSNKAFEAKKQKTNQEILATGIFSKI